MLVLDTSVFVDAIIPKVAERHNKAFGLIRIASKHNLALYEPKVLMIELAGVLSRYKTREIVISHISRITGFINILDYSEIHDTAYDIALETGCRAIDALFIATALVTDSKLISNDKVQIANARRAGIDAYYLVEEYETVIEGIEGS